MKKTVLSLSVLCALCLALGACCRCETEPTVDANHKLIVPPNFGNKPA